MISLNKAKPVAYICSFESTTCSYEREENLNKTFCYEGNMDMAWVRMFATAGIGLYTLKAFWQMCREEKKKKKVDVCCIEVWRGEEHMACTAFPDM